MLFSFVRGQRYLWLKIMHICFYKEYIGEVFDHIVVETKCFSSQKYVGLQLTRKWHLQTNFSFYVKNWGLQSLKRRMDRSKKTEGSTIVIHSAWLLDNWTWVVQLNNSGVNYDIVSGIKYSKSRWQLLFHISNASVYNWRFTL